MSYAARRSFPPRPYGTRPYGVAPMPLGGGLAAGASAGVLGGALGAIGGTLGCLLCLAAIGALGLFSCVVAITAYTKKFLDQYKRFQGINGAGQMEIGFVILLVSLVYTIACRIHRS